MIAEMTAARDVERFRASIARWLGLHMDHTKHALLVNVLEERTGAHGPAAAYLSMLETLDPPREELRALARILTTTETYFFRNRDQFRALNGAVLPELASARLGSRKVRILSAACASGEEAYSLAIAAREHPALAGLAVEICAFDVNPAMLEKAAAGRYSSWSLRDSPQEAIDRWFDKDRGEFVLHDSIRSMVRFEERNLMDEAEEFWEPGSFDVVFCRNVIMYFSPEKAAAVVARIARALAPGGYLFLGHAETLRGLSHDFNLLHTHDTFYYRRKGELEREESWLSIVGQSTERIQALAERSLSPTVERVERSASPSARISAAMEMFEGERFADALELLQHVRADEAEGDEVLLLRAALLAHVGRLAAAESACRELLGHDDMHAGAHYLLALCREGGADPRGAQEHYQAAAYLDPGFAMPHLHLGVLARRDGDLETARDELNRALILLQREEPSRLLLFGGGFNRDALIALCRAELTRMGGEP